MKYPKWYTTNNFIGFLLFAAYFNPTNNDKLVWDWMYALAVAVVDIAMVIALFNMVF